MNAARAAVDCAIVVINRFCVGNMIIIHPGRPLKGRAAEPWTEYLLTPGTLNFEELIKQDLILLCIKCVSAREGLLVVSHALKDSREGTTATRGFCNEQVPCSVKYIQYYLTRTCVIPNLLPPTMSTSACLSASSCFFFDPSNFMEAESGL